MFATFCMVAVVLSASPLRAQANEEETTTHQLFTQFCGDCHNARRTKAGLDFDALVRSGQSRDTQRTWQLVRKMILRSEMPPEDQDQPSAEQRATMLAHVDRALAPPDCDGPVDPGRVTLRRLNRAEYRQTIRDLTGIDYQPTADFPADDTGYGFDHIGDVLSLSPLLFERYLDAAESILDQAIMTDNPATSRITRYQAERMDMTVGSRPSEGVAVMYSQSDLSARYTFALDADYRLRVRASADQAGDEPARMSIRIDQQMIAELEVAADRRDWRHYEVQIPISAGERHITISFINDYYKPDAPDGEPRDRNLFIDWIEIEGPLAINPDDALPNSHRRIMIGQPEMDDTAAERAAAQQIIARFTLRAYRRPATPAQLAQLLSLFDTVRKHEDSFERAIQITLQAVLVSPSFLFRVEQDQPPDNPDQPLAGWRLDDFEIASRLSYFLWGTMPDEKLLRAAARGELRDDEAVRGQARRMLAHTKANNLANRFASQWLLTRNLAAVQPDAERYETFDDELRSAMREETLRLFTYIMHDDRGVLELLDADYTFINARLAAHYDLPMPAEAGISSDGWARVSLKDSPRRGVLGHASVLTVTSNPTRTSPVKRGLFVLDQLLNDPPPPPPPGIPELEETGEQGAHLSLREQMEIHRREATCRSCHEVMDPIGFAFEQFDAVGRFRETENDQPIDASGELPDGTRFVGLTGLTEFLMRDPDRFTRTLCEKMLTYALGRGLEYEDHCAIERIVDAVKADDHRFSSMVLAIVTSDPFLRRRAKVTDHD